jgi:hypothetical protein
MAGNFSSATAVSELVRGRTAHFLTALEDRIDVLNPAETKLEIDTSPHFTAGLLHIEAMLRRNLPNDDRIRLGHRAVMDLVAYQLDPALQALKQPRQRILIADATGLGKTLEAGILATELIQRGRGSRILVVTLKSMLTQFQKEFWTRFSIPLVRLDSVGLAQRLGELERRLGNQIPEMALTQQLGAGGAKKVRAAIPRGAALVELVRFEPYRLGADRSGGEDGWAPRRSILWSEGLGRPGSFIWRPTASFFRTSRENDRPSSLLWPREAAGPASPRVGTRCCDRAWSWPE